MQRGSTKATPATRTLRDLDLLIRSRYALIHLDEPEEARAEALLRELAQTLQLPLFVWKRVKGLRRADSGNAVYGTEDLRGALAHVECARFPAIYCFHGVTAELASPEMVTLLSDAVAPYETSRGALILTGTGLELPEVLRSVSAVVQMPVPSPQDYRDLVDAIHRDVSRRQHVEITLGPGELSRLAHNLRGLSLTEAGKVLTRAMVEDGKLSAADIALVIQAKKERVEREGLLEYVPLASVEVAGLHGLKAWLRQRSAILTQPEKAAAFGLTFPKGILLLGVPGCGKSLCAKAVGQAWQLPLLKLDPSRLFDKYIGESERNFKRALATAERCAPVVLWIDELEKAFPSQGDQDGGTSKRIFGTFLTWMQERREPVFLVATANDVEGLPAEFLRKGRFDETFFVDLPCPEVRDAILRIHLGKRGQDPEGFDLPALVRRSEGFSGAELEQCVVAALFAAFAAQAPVTTATLLYEIDATQPLSVTMGEKIAALRAWAEPRVRRAD